MGQSAEQILRFYEEQGAAIFPSAKGVGGWLKTLRRFSRAQFSPDALRKAIGSVVGDKPLRRRKRAW